MTVLLATCADLPARRARCEALDAALAARGDRPRVGVWDDASVDWAAADLVVVRSTWDYVDRAGEFLDWTRSLDQSRLLNGADVFAWNHDKAYLADLGPSRRCRPRLASSADGRFAAADRRVRHARSSSPASARAAPG